MKVLHVMRKSKFSRAILCFMDRRFNHDTNEVCYFISDDDDSYIQNDISLKQHEFRLFSRKARASELAKFIHFQKQYDYIILHSYFVNSTLSLFWSLKPERIVWLSWGYDLYRFVYEKQRRDIKFKMDRYIKSRIGTFVGIFPPDCDCYKMIFPKSRAVIKYVPYRTDVIDPVYLNYVTDSRLSQTVADNDTVYIQVGHNAYEKLNHISVLNRLSRFADNNIHILMPMSYGGTKDYIKKVKEVAEDLFPGKHTIITDFLPLEKYNALVDRVDIAIFEIERQIGLGNINRMIAKNVKLYMPSSSVMYQFFSSKGIPIQKTDNLNEIDYKEFISTIEYDQFEGVKEFVDERASVEYTISKWNDLFQSLEER